MKWAYDHELKRRDCVSRKIRDMGRQPGAGVLVVGRRVPHGALPSPIIDSFCLRVVRAMRCRLDGEYGGCSPGLWHVHLAVFAWTVGDETDGSAFGAGPMVWFLGRCGCL